MTDTSAVAEAAIRLSKQKDAAALELLIGMRARAIESNPALANDAEFDPNYETRTMGALDEAKQLGIKIVNRWNRELYEIVCAGDDRNRKERVDILNAMNLGEAAVIATVASVLLGSGLSAALAAAVAPLLVKRFIWPAKEELCLAWREWIKAAG